ncbi:MAG: metallophosphoesterase [Candidatus Hydrothermarchaeota archaeon]
MGRKIKILLILLFLLGMLSLIIFPKRSKQYEAELIRGGGENAEVITIGVISDTHIPKRAQKLPREIYEIFENTSMIIHAGDMVDTRVINELEKISRVIAVYGNMDPPQIREKFPKINSIEIYGWKIGVTHNSIIRSGEMKEIAMKNDFDVLIFGHTHRASIVKENGRIYLNPGSPTNPLLAKPSVAVLKVSRNKITARIVEI